MDPQFSRPHSMVVDSRHGDLGILVLATTWLHRLHSCSRNDSLFDEVEVYVRGKQNPYPSLSIGEERQRHPDSFQYAVIILVSHLAIFEKSVGPQNREQCVLLSFCR